MDYTTVFKIAEKWSVTTACVYYAIKKGRISGAVFIDGRWYIPVNTKNPTKIVAPKAGYISAKKAADKWGITKVAVYTVAKEGRIPGAKFADGRWHIPEGTQGTVDGRRKQR